MACDNQRNSWEEYELQRREEKLDRLLRCVSLITFILITFSTTDIFLNEFFFYQQLDPRSYGNYRYASFSIWIFVIGYAMLHLTYALLTVKGEELYQKKTMRSQIMWGLVFTIAVIINHLTNPRQVDDPYIINIYHWAQTISYISIVLLNRLLIALIMKCKKKVYQVQGKHFGKVAIAIWAFSCIVYLVLSMFCSKFPKFFY